MTDDIVEWCEKYRKEHNLSDEVYLGMLNLIIEDSMEELIKEHNRKSGGLTLA